MCIRQTRYHHVFNRTLQLATDNEKSRRRNMFTVINIIDSFQRTVVEWCEVVHKFQRRQRVIVFCQSILNRQNKQICDVVDDQDFSSFNVGEIHLAKDTFEQSFKSVCNELFKMQPANTSYIIAIFAYAMKLNEYHLLHSKAWYESKLLTCSLVDVLIAYGF